jgi:NADPH-dependent 2,4-dienoyl-CoA reductase/sulfur reductase-like enzyme
MTTEAHASINRTARLAGAQYLAVMPFAFFGIMSVPSVLLVPGDPAGTSRKRAVREFLRTTDPNVYAAGDVIGDPMFVYVAAYGRGVAAENALTGNRRRYDLSVLPAPQRWGGPYSVRSLP